MMQKKKRVIGVFLLFAAMTATVVLLAFAGRAARWRALRRELVSRYDDEIGAYDTGTLGLVDCPRETAEKIAASLGAGLSMDGDLRYGTLVLPEGTDAVAALSAADGRYLSYLSPNVILYPEDIGTNDTFADKMESLDLSLMNLGDTWKSTAGNAGGKRVRIAVIDSGIDYTHEDLVGRISELSYSVPAGKSVKDAGGDFSILKATGTPHGTKVSSVIMAAADNGLGIAGIAYDCEFVFIKLTDTSGAFRSAEMMAGISYATSIGCDVINLSLGGYEYITGCDSVIAEANASGAVVVCAAGNDRRSDPHYPSSCAGVVSVGALGSYNYFRTGADPKSGSGNFLSYTAIADYSNYGKVDVVAPGTWITASDSLFCDTYPNDSTAKKDITAKDTLYDAWYNVASGTSIASPAVAAVIGLYKSLHPDAASEDIRRALYASCTDLGDEGYDEFYGYGMVDISAFVLGTYTTVTYDFSSSSLGGVALTAAVGRTATSVPSVPENGELVFAGWYADKEKTVPVNPYTYTFGDTPVTFYAAWADATDVAVPFDMRLVDPTLRMIDLMVECGDGNSYFILAHTATEIFRTYSDVRAYPDLYDEIYGIIRKTQSEAMADKTARAICDRTAVYTVYGYYGGKADVTVPDSADGLTVAGIGPRAFSGSTVTHVSLPDTVEYIGDGAFSSCRSLTWMQIPESVRMMGAGVFTGTDNASLATLLSEAPGGWTHSKYFYRAMTETSFGYDKYTHNWNGGKSPISYATERVFRDGMELVIGTDGYRLVSAASAAGDVAFPTIDGKNLTEIGDGAFAGNTAVTGVTLPASLLSVGVSAFENCTALTFVSTEAATSLTTVGASAFAGCTALGTFAVPPALTDLPSRAFAGCTSLFELTFSGTPSLRSIGTSAFSDCVSLSRVSLLDCTSLTSVGGSAFRGCTSLILLTVPSQTENIANGALAGCDALRFLELPYTGGSASSNAVFGALFGADTAEKAETVVPDSLKVLIVTQRSRVTAGMLAGVSGARVYLTNTDDSSVRAVLPEGNTYAFRGQWKSIPAFYGETHYADLPYTSDTSSLLADLPSPGGLRVTGLDTDGDGAADVPTGTESAVTLLGTAETYTVTYLDRTGTSLAVYENLPFGATVPMPSDPADDETAYATYRFDKWSRRVVRATEHLTVSAVYTETPKVYTVTLKDRDSDRQALYTLRYGDEIPPLPTYTEAGYRYTFFFADGTRRATVTGSGTVTGYFVREAIRYTVTFVNADGTTLSQKEYGYMDTVILPETPTKAPTTRYTYEFAGWDRDVETTVTHDARYEATYREVLRYYTVKFTDYDGTVLSEAEYPYEDTVRIPPAPERPDDDRYSYTFSAWSPGVTQTTKVREDVTYTAIYTMTPRSVNIEFRDYDGTVLSSSVVAVGTVPAAPTPPERAPEGKVAYVFDGWDKTLTPATEDTVYTAVYREEARRFTVRFVDKDGRLIAEETYAYGETPRVPDGYTGTVSPVIGSAEYVLTKNKTGCGTSAVGLLLPVGLPLGICAVPVGGRRRRNRKRGETRDSEK